MSGVAGATGGGRAARGDGPAQPASGTLAEAQVQAMFDRIAAVYDAMNSVMTAGLHRRWRERAADLARLEPGGRALDVATGTGDLALALARRVGPGGEVVGCDFSEAMLELARRKVERRAEEGSGGGGAAKAPGGPALADVRFERANALELPYPDDAFDAATVGFGVRNFADLERALAELARVVRPGGRVVVLEITRPRRAPLSWFFRLWFDLLVPLLGRIAGDPDAYAYLPSSVRRFPDPAALGALLARCGLEDVRWLVTAGGTIALHSGTVAAR